MLNWGHDPVTSFLCRLLLSIYVMCILTILYTTVYILKILQIYCRDMNTSIPLEYLTLSKEVENFSEIYGLRYEISIFKGTPKIAF